ncbi:MAG: hemerythrin family protein [Clostridiales bacterium]|nr:hemerythrin family protein [Clostridiales bacterium]
MIKWNDNFSVNHAGIDEQHKELIDIINDLVVYISEKDTEFSHLLDLVTKLDNYVAEHFKYEEALMTEHSYPEMDVHVAQHNGLRKKLEELNIFSVDNTIEFYKELLDELIDWLSKHIMQTDKKLGAYLTIN